MRRLRAATVITTMALATNVVACKRNAAAAKDAGADAGDAGTVAASALVLDGPFAAVATAQGAAVVASAANAVALVDVNAEAKETSRTVVANAPAAAVAAYALDGGALAVLYAARAGEAQSAVMVTSARKVVGGPVAVGTETCATDDALFFIDPSVRKLRRWEKGAPAPRDPEGPALDTRASLLCSTRRAFIVEPAGSSFHLITTDRFVRVPLVDGVDPTAGGASAFYTNGDVVGLVAMTAENQLAWATFSASEAQPNVRRLNRKLAADQTLVVADGDATSMSVLLQRDGRRRCKEEESPPSYELFEFGKEGKKFRERSTVVSPIPCDAEATTPEIERAADVTYVRWLEWKDDDKTRRLRTWKMPTGAGESASTVATTTGDAVLLDCSKGCSAVTREENTFRLVR